MSGARITLRIDRVVLDRPGLTHAALAEALRSEIAALVAREGVAALGPGRSLAQVPGNLIRLNVGGEHPADIIADLDQALSGIPDRRLEAAWETRFRL